MQQIKDYSKYGWSDPPHKLHQLIYETDSYTLHIILKVFSWDNIEIDDVEIIPNTQKIKWIARKKRRGLQLTEEDKAIEESYPYWMLERKGT